jgi:hypothetical protein
MMKKMTKLALALTAVAASTGASAQTLSIDNSESIGVESASAGTLVVITDADFEVELNPSGATAAGDRLTLTLSAGTFAEQVLLAQSGTETAGAEDTSEWQLVTPVSDFPTASVTFRAVSGLAATAEFTLQGSTIANDPEFTAPAGAAGSNVTISATTRDNIGTYDTFTAVELFEFASEYGATTVDTALNGIIDVNSTPSRTSFTTGTTDLLGVDFVQNTVPTNVAALAASDDVTFTLTGDFSGITSVSLRTATTNASSTTGENRGAMTVSGSTATITVDASDVFAGSAGGQSSTIVMTASNGSPMAVGDYELAVAKSIKSTTGTGLAAAAGNAGSFTINGMQAKVAQMSVGYASVTSWMKVTNETATSVDVIADIKGSKSDGTEITPVTNVVLGTIDANAVGTVSASAVATAAGLASGESADLFLDLTVTGAADNVHVVSILKNSEGRTMVPVYVNSAGRNYVQ